MASSSEGDSHSVHDSFGNFDEHQRHLSAILDRVSTDLAHGLSALCAQLDANNDDRSIWLQGRLFEEVEAFRIQLLNNHETDFAPTIANIEAIAKSIQRHLRDLGLPATNLEIFLDNLQYVLQTLASNPLVRGLGILTLGTAIIVSGVAVTADTGYAASPVDDVLQENCEIHKVAVGENLSSIAARYVTTVAEIQRLNGISNPNLIRPGQTLKIPCTTSTPAQPAVTIDPPVPVSLNTPPVLSNSVVMGGQTNPIVTPAPTAGQQRSADVAECPTGYYCVQAGDTLSRIAQEHGTTTGILASANGIRPTDRLLVGQKLTIMHPHEVSQVPSVKYDNQGNPRPNYDPITQRGDDALRDPQELANRVLLEQIEAIKNMGPGSYVMVTAALALRIPPNMITKSQVLGNGYTLVKLTTTAAAGTGAVYTTVHNLRNGAVTIPKLETLPPNFENQPQVAEREQGIDYNWQDTELGYEIEEFLRNDKDPDSEDNPPPPPPKEQEREPAGCDPIHPSDLYQHIPAANHYFFQRNTVHNTKITYDRPPVRGKYPIGTIATILVRFEITSEDDVAWARWKTICKLEHGDPDWDNLIPAELGYGYKE